MKLKFHPSLNLYGDMRVVRKRLFPLLSLVSALITTFSLWFHFGLMGASSVDNRSLIVSFSLTEVTLARCLGLSHSLAQLRMLRAIETQSKQLRSIRLSYEEYNLKLSTFIHLYFFFSISGI